jgi:hypothetical protein
VQKPEKWGVLVSKCWRCQQPCKEGTEFCEGCRSYLHDRLQQSKMLSQPLLPEHAKGTALIALRKSNQAGVQGISVTSQNDATVSLEESDPLVSRHLPNITESRIIEEEDFKRALNQREVMPPPASTAALRLAGRRFQTKLRDQKHIRLRITLFSLVIVVIFAFCSIWDH